MVVKADGTASLDRLTVPLRLHQAVKRIMMVEVQTENFRKS